MLLSLFKTTGHSMEPTIKEGSFFLSSNLIYKFTSPKIGDVIVFKNENKNIVKRILEIDNGKYFIFGDNLKDSKKFESIKKQDILGKVIWKF